MLLALNNATFSFGARTMLDEATWQINEGERIGLIGPNGAGKSTLLRLIMGEYSLESGTIQKANDVTIGFFNQDLLSFSTEDSILTVCMGAYEKAAELERALEHFVAKIEAHPEDEHLLMEYSEALHQFELAGGYEMEHNAAQVLEGLGFDTEMLHRSYNTFSGGWRMRVLLAKMILQQPDILMLDEPTNHLDLPSIEWLEKYLNSYPGTVLIVSHDRYFLDRMVTRTVDLFGQKLVSYSGNYSFYEMEKATRMEFLEREFENQQKYIKQEERFIERFKAKASKAKQAQSAMKRLDKLDKVIVPDANVPRMNISFDVGTQPGKIINEIAHASKAYGDNIILKDTKIEILRGDKIALLGANGKGKSTLLRMIAGDETFEGQVGGGHNVKASFYAQHQLEDLGMENSILEEMKTAGTGKPDIELRQLLGCFLFTGDDVFKKIKVLSGGEKARVALAKVIAGKANFLLLDEPTNHLDMTSVELLIEALNQYQGTYILVSHDRYFVSRTANKYWDIRQGKVNEFQGTFEEWEEWKEKLAAKELSALPMKRKEVKEPKPAAAPTDIKLQQEQQKTIEKLEAEIETEKERKTNLELELAKPQVYSDAKQSSKVLYDIKMVDKQLEKLEKQFDQAFEKLISLQS